MFPCTTVNFNVQTNILKTFITNFKDVCLVVNMNNELLKQPLNFNIHIIIGVCYTSHLRQLFAVLLLF